MWKFYISKIYFELHFFVGVGIFSLIHAVKRISQRKWRSRYDSSSSVGYTTTAELFHIQNQVKATWFFQLGYFLQSYRGSTLGNSLVSAGGSRKKWSGTCNCMQELLVVWFRLPWVGILIYVVQSTRVYVEHRFFYVDCKTLQVGIECVFEEYMFNFTLLNRADELNC